MHSVNYGDKQINFVIRRKNVKNINLTVKRNLQVYVSANNRVPVSYIKEFVYEKAEWIEKHLNYYKSVGPRDQDEKQYVDGEEFLYLGKAHKLKAFQSKEQEIKFFNNTIHLYVDNLGDVGKKERLINNWYRQRAKDVFEESLESMYKLMKGYDIGFPELKIRKMKSRWGTCYYKNNKIIINSVLIKAPKDCIDYVILHELVHFVHHKHDCNFYGLMDILMPDWRERRKVLSEDIAKEL